MEEKWISLLDYALKKRTSLSTVRRQIKSKKLPFRLEKGRYFVLDELCEKTWGQEEAFHQVVKLQQALQAAQKEIVELKTLLAFYEEKTYD